MPILQPSMGSTLYTPQDALKPYVECFIISEIPDESVYKVLPGTGLVMGFQFSGNLFQVLDEKQVGLSRSGITGINDTYRLFKNVSNTGTVLVCFNPGGAAMFFHEPIHELFQRSVSLDNFILRSELLLFEEQLCEAPTHAEKIRVVEHFLLTRMKGVKPDMMVINALELIYQSKGLVKINALSKQLNISQSPLEKRFRKIVGTSPKKFAAIVRFRNIIQNVDASPSLTALGYDGGFFDQSHFIKEFKRFTGDTPEAYFKSR
jgi:AraC-like DNA-binding protein